MTLADFLSLPSDLFRLIVSEWLGFIDLSDLDVAVCNIRRSDYLLSLAGVTLESLAFTIIGKD